MQRKVNAIWKAVGRCLDKPSVRFMAYHRLLSDARNSFGQLYSSVSTHKTLADHIESRGPLCARLESISNDNIKVRRNSFFACIYFVY